ncbi:MAG TPA: hypothetical protein VKH19_18715 [Gemmatimonadaceae bacterium]|nr:hypothetical protein [Gemmatimonadaceae bacterium]
MTNRGWCLLAGVLGGVLACATPKPAADTAVGASAVNAANAIDTLKPAVVATPDSVGATAAASTKANIPATKTSSKTASTTTRRDTAGARDRHLGRDSVIKRDPADPSRMIPPKKP